MANSDNSGIITNNIQLVHSVVAIRNGIELHNITTKKVWIVAIAHPHTGQKRSNSEIGIYYLISIAQAKLGIPTLFVRFGLIRTRTIQFSLS